MTIEEKERIYSRLQAGEPFTLFRELEDRVYQFQNAPGCYVLYLNDSYIGSWTPKRNQMLSDEFIEVGIHIFGFRKPHCLWLNYIVFLSDKQDANHQK